MQRIQQALIAVSAVVYAVIGLWLLIDPVGPLAPVGVTVLDDRGLVEIRAMYGGLQLGIAAFLAWTLLDRRRYRPGLMAATLSIGGLGLVRLVTWLVVQPADGAVFLALAAVEVGGAVAGAVVLYRTRSDA